MMKFGPDERDPLLVLGGVPALSLRDREDGGVLATAFAAKADMLVTDNLRDFEVGDCEIFETSLARRPDGSVRRLTCQLHTRPDSLSLVVVHPIDFVHWVEKRFDCTPASVRSTYDRRSRPARALMGDAASGT